jgi:hypothetical protein
VFNSAQNKSHPVRLTIQHQAIAGDCRRYSARVTPVRRPFDGCKIQIPGSNPQFHEAMNAAVKSEDRSKREVLEQLSALYQQLAKLLVKYMRR